MADDKTEAELAEIKKEEDEIKAKQLSDQQEYDIVRSADEDAKQEEKDAHNKKPNDITFSPNRTNKQTLSDSTYIMAHNLTPGLPRVFIGRNSYLLLPRRLLDLFSKDAQAEIEEIHGKHEHPIPNDAGHYNEHSEIGIAIPVKAQNTPQPFNLPNGIHAEMTPTDVWEENLAIDRERRGI